MTKEEALAKAMQICSIRECSASEIEDKLNKWGIPVIDHKLIIEYLRREKFIDDFRLAKYYTNDKLRFNKWGKVKIRIMLQQKGIGDEAIISAMDQVDKEKYFDVLKEELSKKRNTIKDDDDYIIKGKLFKFATGRGFEAELIYRVLNSLE